MYVLISLRYILRSGIAGLYGNSPFSFLRNSQTVFRCSCTILNSHQPSSPTLVICYLFDERHPTRCAGMFLIASHLIFTFLWESGYHHPISQITNPRIKEVNSVTCQRSHLWWRGCGDCQLPLCPGAEPTLPGQACYPSRPFSAGFSLCCKWNSLLRYSGREATEHFLQTVLPHLSSETDHPLWLSAFLLLRVGKNPGGQDAIQRALLSPPLHVLGEFPVPAPLGCR